MSKQTINIGLRPNDGTGDTIRTAFTKTNNNFTEIFNTAQAAFNAANSVSFHSSSIANGEFQVTLNGDNGNLTVPGTISGPEVTTTWTDTITAISLGTETIVTFTDSHFGGPTSGQMVISGVNGTTEINGTWYYQAWDNNQIKLFNDVSVNDAVDSTEWTTYVDGGVGENIVGGGVSIEANYNTWDFNTDGNLYSPGNVVIGGGNNSNGNEQHLIIDSSNYWTSIQWKNFDSPQDPGNTPFECQAQLLRVFATDATVTSWCNVDNPREELVAVTAIRPNDTTHNGLMFSTSDGKIPDAPYNDGAGTRYDWILHGDGTMKFPNNIINANTQSLDMKSSNYVEMWYQAQDADWRANPQNNSETYFWTAGDGTYLYHGRGNDEVNPSWNHQWEWKNDGSVQYPNLATNARTGSGNALIFDQNELQKVIGTKNGTVTHPTVERIVIAGGDGYGSGEGGDIYLWAGRSATDTNGGGNGGGDIKVDAGDGYDVAGGTIKIRGGNSQVGSEGYAGQGGWIQIDGGSTWNGGDAGDITLNAGSAYNGGTDGKLRVTTNNGTYNWDFGANGALTLPSGEPILFGNGNSRIQAGMGFHINSEEGISLESVDVTDTENPVTKAWYFGTDGSLTLPGQINNIIGGTITTGDYWGDPVYPQPVDLTKTINKLSDNTGSSYTLADGVEGQIMYLVPKNSATVNGIYVVIANARILNSVTTSAAVFTDVWYYPFADASTSWNNNIATLIFTDGAWNVSTGSFDY